MRALGLVSALMAATTGVRAIYPDDHWNYSTKVTMENFDGIVQEEIEAGRTLFVRWIASPQ